MKSHLFVCVSLLLLLFIEFLATPKAKKWKYIKTHIFLFLIAIPYLNIIHYMGWHVNVDKNIIGILRFVPLLLGTYSLGYIVNWINGNKIGSLLETYLILLIGSVYFCSIIFYELEKGLNSMVNTYWDSLWWAFMDTTTVGSNIYAVTPIGKFLSVLLAAFGMMMFPIFTVYITNIVTQKREKLISK
jgi:Ion channel.